MSGRGAFRERLQEAWVEIRENLGRATLQSLGVMLGVASVLGGFSITDSMRKRSEQMYVKMGGLDKLSVQNNPVSTETTPTALRMANKGLRQEDQQDAAPIQPKEVEGVSIVRGSRARIRSAYADQERQITGIGGDYLALEGYELAEGRTISPQDLDGAAPVAVIGFETAKTFFPDGKAIGATMRIGDTPVTVVGTLQERVFRFRKDQHYNFFWRQNRIVAVPSTLVQRRMQGDLYGRFDRITYRLPKIEAMPAFMEAMKGMLKVNHRMEEDFRMDDVQTRMRKRDNQGQAYDIIFMLSGILALLGGGLVNVNIQLASLKERVREVGVKMAIGASGGEVFKGFMTEAMLLTALGGLVGLVMGVGFSWVITYFLGIPLTMAVSSFVWAYVLAGMFGCVFALYPAWKASRLSPMEALRYE